MSNIGKTFVDLSVDVYPIYAVGRTGFMHMVNDGGATYVGTFIPYDSTFTGPEFFDNKVFIQCRVTW